MSEKKRNNVLFVVLLLLLILSVLVVITFVLPNRKQKEVSLVANEAPPVSSSVETPAPTPTPDELTDPKVLLPDTYIPPENRQIAPDFTLPDLQGKQISLSDFKGKFVLLDFTTTWCGYCTKQAPSLVELLKQNKKDLVVLAVDCRESKKDVEEHYPNGVPYPLVLDEAGEVTANYGVSSWPFYYLLSPTGETIYYQIGFREDMVAQVNAVLDVVRAQ